MDNDLWRWADPDGQQRTVSISELRAALAGGLIAPNTPVWRDGWDGWRSAHEVPELTSASLGGANGVVLNIPPPPLAMVAVQQEYEAASSSIAPAPPVSVAPKGGEPPPPPAYIPAVAKASASALKTQIGGSKGVSAPPPPLPARASSAPKPSPGAAQMSMPTTIGLPAPPMPLGATPARPRADQAPMVEELSDSALLESKPAMAAAKPRNGVIPTPANGALPPPTDPVVPEGRASLDDDALSIPRRPGLSVIFEDIAAIRRGEPPKNKLLLGVLGIVGLSVVIMVIAGIISLASGPSTPKANAAAGRTHGGTPSARPSTPPSSAAPPATSAPIPPPPPATAEASASGSGLGDCSAGGEAKLIAPRAVVQSGIEAQALPGGLALAFAASPRDAVATMLDPTSLAPTATVRTRPSGGDARHVTPMLLGGKLTAVPDVERRGDRLAGRRVVTTSNLIDIGHMDGAVEWAPHGRDSFAKLFSIDNEAQIEALRAVPLPDKKGVALAFRRGNAVVAAVAKGENVLELSGGVSTIAGLGQVGSPAIAVSGDEVMVAWADRASGDDDWKIRVARFEVGGATEEATTFPVPEGGLGGPSMSPSVASLGGGRFFLAWTEGPVSSHQIRAVAVGTDGLPSGSAISISGAGVNAGQPSAVVGESGHGAVAFLAAKGKALEVHATPISCVAR